MRAGFTSENGGARAAGGVSHKVSREVNMGEPTSGLSVTAAVLRS